MRDLDQTVIKFDHDKNFKNEDFYKRGNWGIKETSRKIRKGNQNFKV